MTSYILNGFWSKSVIGSPETILNLFPQDGHSSSSASMLASLNRDLSAHGQLPSVAKKPDSIL